MIERETIYQRVWGYSMAHGDRSVDVFVRKLRQKLRRHSPSWRYIHTHFGIGYRFDPETPLDEGEPVVTQTGSEPEIAPPTEEPAISPAPERAAG